MISPERLRRQPHCAGAPDALLREVATISQERSFAADEELFVEGNRATHLMFLESGEVDVRYELRGGKRVVVDTLVAGDTMAWSALLEPHILTATGVARGPGVLIAIDGAKLLAICLANPAWGYLMMTNVAITLRDRLTATRVQLAAAS
jgi:CRP/FNR family cyclic AMP-dependent transcriptional regulator